MYYGQNYEDKIVSEYFGDFVGTLLEIGANDGQTLSNSYALIQKGWSAALVEPSPSVAHTLWQRHVKNNKVAVYEFAIAEKSGRDILWDSGTLLQKGDKALVSTLRREETERWASAKIPFQEVEVMTITFRDFMKLCAYKNFDFISIDAEGMDLAILKQMNLSSLGCKCICIEHNSHANVVREIQTFCRAHGLYKLIGENAENVILAK